MNSMRTRWIVAGVGALALALLTMSVPLEWPFHRHDAVTEGAACPADAKPANLNFTLKDMNNRDVRLSDFKGKVILLDFWATWCGPCKVEIPWFAELQEKYGPAGLQVVGVSVDDTHEQLDPRKPCGSYRSPQHTKSHSIVSFRWRNGLRPAMATAT